ncbi:DUF4932 domain-containing protein [Cytophagaceae bacterium DM2B3-1]|uniref:DUF4932 domain-containing protein n=2 Tax=Xanthocytophaga flava TaxID=3048013 RepID=A0ABT7CTN4_9BACT|nr:DUF4932 domain-containing protein [Xanthocytophaga flavus]
MKKASYCLCLVLSGWLMSYTGMSQSSTQGISQKRIAIEFNHNVEFLGFVFFLGSLGSQYEQTEDTYFNGIKKKEWHAFNLSLYRKYKSYQANKDLQTVARFIESLGGSSLIRLLIQVPEFPHATLPASMPKEEVLFFSSTNDSLEAYSHAQEFLQAANRFYKEVHFEKYFQENQRLYDHSMEQIRKNMPPEGFIDAMEQFYRRQFDGYQLLPSLTIPAGMGFGLQLTTAGKTTILNAFGSFGPQRFAKDSLPDMGFANPKRLRELSIHEFGHSFVNPIIADLPAELTESTKSLFDTIKTDMEDQAYQNWKTCLDEHFVRAGEVMISHNLGYSQEAEDLLQYYITGRKFIYLPVIIQELKVYNQNPYVTYASTVQKALEKLQKQSNALSDRADTNGLWNSPEQIQFHTEDIDLFWKVFDKMYPRIQGSTLQKEYIEAGSAGLQNFIKNRIESGNKLAKTIRKELDYYQAIRASSLSIASRKEQFYTCFHNLKQLYPEAQFPDVYFVIGRKNTGGTIFKGGLLIGAEMFGQPTATFTPRIPIDYLDELISHELIHFQQKYSKNNSLLAQCIREGAADFLGELISGAHGNQEMYHYAEQHKQELWKEFLARKDDNNWQGWLYYSKDTSRPKDLGYWMGYKITQSYYQHATDKSQAIKDILTIQDFTGFLEKSKCTELFVNP